MGCPGGMAGTGAVSGEDGGADRVRGGGCAWGTQRMAAGRLGGAGAYVGQGCGGGGVGVGRAGAGGAGRGETATSTGTGRGGANVGLTALKADAGARVLAFDASGWQLQVRASFLAHVAARLCG